MITHLSIKNLVLVESCTLSFQSNFTVLTGETGAGKTALTEAIDLALGARADSALIRKGEEKAYVEAAFDITSLPLTQHLLDEAGIPFTSNEDLIIRRELTREGKNRSFVNGHLVPLPLLQKIGSTLLELIGQHAYHTLISSEAQRSIVDRFGDLDVRDFQTAYHHEKEQKAKLSALLLKDSQREKEEGQLRSQLDEIESVKLKDGEEEEISQEHQRLAHVQEILEKLSPITQGLSQFLPNLNRYHKACESLLHYDKLLGQPAALLHEASIATTETLNELQSYSERLEKNPNRFLYLEERIGAIHSLKRKYGADFAQIEQFRLQAKEKLFQLENLSDEIDALQAEILLIEKETERLAQILTQKRKQIADLLSQQLTSQLQSLNMQGAELQIHVQATPRSQWGDDHIQFWMRANVGEQSVPVKDHSSGGELSRLLFVIKTALSEKNQTPTLIFDEIDANVGGKTATVIGEKLKELGNHRQVICITHFPQVASKADHHFSVQKMESDGRTVTTIQSLEKNEREKEILRMLGGDKKAFL